MRVPEFSAPKGVFIILDGERIEFPQASRFFANKHGHIEIICKEKTYAAGMYSFSTHTALGYFGRFDRVGYISEEST